jgi:hypothetical protein
VRARSAAAQRSRAAAQLKDQDAFRFLDHLRHFLLHNGSPGRQEITIERAPDDLAEAKVRLGWRLATLCVGDQKDRGDTVLLFSDRTEVAEAEHFREFESCTVRWNEGSSSGPSGGLTPRSSKASPSSSRLIDWTGMDAKPTPGVAGDSRRARMSALALSPWVRGYDRSWLQFDVLASASRLSSSAFEID